MLSQDSHPEFNPIGILRFLSIVAEQVEKPLKAAISI